MQNRVPAARDMRPLAAGGDHGELTVVGWPPLRDPSLRSGSLRSGQPTTVAKGSPRRKSSRGVPSEPKDTEASPLPFKASFVVQRIGSTSDFQRVPGLRVENWLD